MGIILFRHRFRSICESHLYTLISIGCLFKNMSLYYSALEQYFALVFATGIYLSDYYLWCKYRCNRSLHLGSVGVQRNFP